MVINDNEAMIVKTIFRRTIEGFSYMEIIDELNSKGFLTKRGGIFTKNSLNSILQNRKYTGVYVYNKSASKDVDGKRNGHKYKDESEIICVEDAVPPIISKEEFEIVQQKLSQRKKNRKHSRAIENYLLTNKMICGICGGAYVGARRRRGDKSMWTAYGCNVRYRNKIIGCKNKEISKPYIEGCVLEKLADLVFNDAYIPVVTREYNKYLQDKNGDYVFQLKNLQNQLKALNNDINKLVDLLMKTTSQILIDKLNESEKKKLQIEAKIKSLSSDLIKQEITESDVTLIFQQIKKQLTSGNLKSIKQVIETYVDKIIVYPNEVIVKLNFFPDFRFEPDGKEKDCPETERLQHIQGQSSHPMHQQWLMTLAEKEGFEPSNRFWRLHDFQSCALDQLGDFSIHFKF